MCFLLSNGAMSLFERVVFLNSEELVSIVTTDNHYVVILVAE